MYNWQGPNKKWQALPAWEVVRSEEKGYGFLTVLNASHATWEMISSVNDTILDQATFVI